MTSQRNINKKISLFVPWFGPWPSWFHLFLISCEYNADIEFIFITDNKKDGSEPANVIFQNYEFGEYKKYISERLNIKPKWDNPYKLCDFKPVLGHLHSELIEGRDFWGYCDIDMVFGNIRQFLRADILEKYDVFSAHEHIVAGHFAVMRNSEKLKAAFRRILHWRYFLEAEKHKSFDERIFSMLFLDDAKRKQRGIHRFLIPKLGGALFEEQFSTSIPGLPWVDGSQNYPSEWVWREGRLTADTAPDRDFMYTHFTHWASKRWSGGDRAVWADVDPLIRVSDLRPSAFKISAAGFSPA